MEDISSKYVLVSVLCTAYNHGNYIRQCLEGFVMQKTDFKFEVIVHDDASVDDTADIVREFEKEYPDIIKPIYQVENQYSKNRGAIRESMLSKAQGRYIAYCEGDDYWCDSQKLQLCIDAFKNDEDIVMVTHNTKVIKVTGEFIDYTISSKSASGVFPSTDMILGINCPRYSSLVVRSDIAKADFPDFFSLVTGDNARRLYAVTCGKIYYINKVMSAYRSMVPGSWTYTQSSSKEKQLQTAKNAIMFYHAYDEYTNHEYSDVIYKAIARRKYTISIIEGNYKEAYKLAKCAGFSTKQKAKLFILSKIPALAKLKGKFKK